MGNDSVFIIVAFPVLSEEYIRSDRIMINALDSIHVGH